MKRLERLGSVSFFTILVSFVFHLLAISFNHWIINDCKICNASDPLSSWRTALHTRCYQASMATIFPQFVNASDPRVVQRSFITEICMPNKFMMIKDESKAEYCYDKAKSQPDTICSLGNYNTDWCKCDYTDRTKASLALAVIAALALGIMIFLSHLISFVKIDYVLRWLIPVCFGLMILSIICIVTILGLMGSTTNEDAREMFFGYSMLDALYKNMSIIVTEREKADEYIKKNFSIKIDWSFGCEVLSLHFTLVTLFIYALMFTAKTRPEPKH